jgi:hypothetical protein
MYYNYHDHQLVVPVYRVPTQCINEFGDFVGKLEEDLAAMAGKGRNQKPLLYNTVCNTY